MKPQTFFTVSNIRTLDPQTGKVSDLPPIAQPILPRQADGQVYSAGDLTSLLAGSVVFSSSSVDGSLRDMMSRPQQFALVISSDGIERGKAVIESRADMQTLMEGGSVEVNWYRKVGDDWEFIERRPMTIAKRTLPTTDE